MKNKKYILGTIAALLLGMGAANADPILSLDPALQDATPGDTVSVDLVASALPVDGIAGYDIDIAFDIAALSFVSYSLSGILGFSFDVSLGDIGGLVNLAELSLEPTAVLVGLQAPPGPIVLATLEFTVDELAPGVSTFLDIFAFSISSGNGNELAGPDLIVQGAEIRNPGGMPVPEPASLLLMATGLLLLRRRVTG